ncbi:MAG: nucleoside 2-deoxyribosyltransferase [Hyphomicrobiaceae bacterium]|nr:MAG: nucleoside 2-deoxyribosyltransferase [Hyphomicrobiaceae bacterium]
MTDTKAGARRPRLYLAGPEVFLPNALAVGQAKAALCRSAGFEGVFPVDQSLDLSGLDARGIARRIFDSDEAMMRSCDAILANLTPFRGVSMDSGTAYEIGFMRALGKPVFGYTNASLGYRRRAKLYRQTGRLPYDGDHEEVQIEDLGLAENLMVEMAVAGPGELPRADSAENRIAGLEAFERALQSAREHFFQDASPGGAGDSRE